MSPSRTPVTCESLLNLVNSPYSNLQLSLISLLIKYSYLSQSWIKHYRTFSQLILLALRWNVGTCACADPSTPSYQHACVQAHWPVSKWRRWLHHTDCCGDSERHRAMIRNRRNPVTDSTIFLPTSSCVSAVCYCLSSHAGLKRYGEGRFFGYTGNNNKSSLLLNSMRGNEVWLRA
jgi:hypothetical protein